MVRCGKREERETETEEGEEGGGWELKEIEARGERKGGKRASVVRS